MHANTDCPCNSRKSFENCCNPILKDHSLADTPEKLMRSRYTAFVVQNANHLLRTWSGSHRPHNIEMNNCTVWLNLEIIEVNLPSPEQKVGNVSFLASFIEAGVLHLMKEKSSFILVDGLWFYTTGDSTIERSKVAMNAKCPCGSGKKYKRCCH